MTNSRDVSRTFWLLVLLALSIRLVVLWINLTHASPFVWADDSRSYIRCADSLVSHFAFLDARGMPTWTRPPGYPSLLALTFATGKGASDNFIATLIVQVLMSTGVVMFATHLALRFAGYQRGMLVGILMALEPSSIASSNLILSETLYTFMLTAAVLACWTWLERPATSRLLGFAFLISLLPLVRPVALHLPWVLCALVIWRAPAGVRVRQGLLFLALALLPSAAWSARNWVHFGSATFDKSGPVAKAMFAREVELRAGSPNALSGPHAPWRLDFAHGHQLPRREAMAIQEKYFTDVIKSHPAEAAKEVLYTGVKLVGVPDNLLSVVVRGHRTPFEEGTVSGRLRWLLTQGWLLPVILLGMALSVGGVLSIPLFAFRIFRARQWKPVAWGFGVFVIVIITYHLALASFVRHAGARYRLPVLPLLALTLVVGTLGVGRTRVEPSVES